jgi:hypothetical protein
MTADEFFRVNRLRLVSRRLECSKVGVFCDHEVGLGGNGAVGELVVIRVSRDNVEPKLRLGKANVAVQLAQQLKQRGDISPPLRTRESDDDFLVFQQIGRGHRRRQPSIQQGAQDGIPWLPPAEDLEEGVGVQADRHA